MAGYGKFNQDDKSFSKAFKHFKNNTNQKTFSWRGKRYSTVTKDENRAVQKIGSSKNVKAGKGRGTIDTGSLRSKRLASKLSSDKNVSTGRGRGTVDTGSLRSKRLVSKLGTGKNIRDTKGKGGATDYRSFLQKAKQFDVSSIVDDLKKTKAYKIAEKAATAKQFKKGGRVKKTNTRYI
tara:strand:- start:74 stop:610 length:537 start_codon:yes stop_codon:yes gene_type:complete